MTGKIIKKNYILAVLSAFVLVLLLFTTVDAEEPQFELNIDDTSLEKGISAELILSVENARGAEVIEIQGLSNFDVLNQNHSTSTHIINGDMLQLDRYHYIIMPVTEGEFSLKAIVKYKGDEYETNQLDVIVKEGNSFNDGEIKELFLKTIMGEKELYFGEKTVLSFELYSRYNIENFGFRDQLDLSGFVSQEISREKLKANYQYIEGNKYVKYEVKKLILTPTDTGFYEIPTSTFQVNVSTSNFFDSSKPVYLHSDTVELEVKPLPLDNQPDNFKGLVGELEIESSYSKHEVEYGDPITLKVKLSGSCNLDNLDKIIDKQIPGVSVYETEKNSHEEVKDGRYFAVKEFEIIIVPDKTGEINIPSINIHYFNPGSKHYEAAVIEDAVIQVSGESGVFNQISEVNEIIEPTETVRIEQINYALANNDYLSIQIKKTYLKTGLYVLIFIVVLGFSLFFFYKYWRGTDDKLRNLFSKVEKENDEIKLFNLLNELIKYKYKISLKSLSRERLKNIIGDKEVLADILEVIKYVENKRYMNNIEIVDIKSKVKKIYQ